MLWQIAKEEDSPALREFLALCLKQNSSNAELIKANPQRSVYLIKESPANAVFLKLHNITKFLHKLKYLLFVSRARKEWDNIQLFKENGIPAPDPIAFYEERSFGFLRKAAIVTRAIKDAVPITEALMNSPADKPATLTELGKEIKKIHNAGIAHRDIHPGNILVNDKGFWFIDLHKAQESISKRAEIRDLGQIIFNLFNFAEMNELRALVNSYSGTKDCERLWLKVLNKAKQLQQRRIKSRAKRCLITSSKFTVDKIKSTTIYRKSDFPKEEAIKIQDINNTADKTLFVKEYLPAGLFRNLRDLFQGSRGKRAWYAANYFSLVGLPTPEPLALIEDCKFKIAKHSFLVTRLIKDAMPLDKYIHSTFVLKDFQKEGTLQFISTLADAVRNLHEKGIYHGDLKANNILVKENRNKYEFCFVDMDSILIWRMLTEKRKTKNIAQLLFSLPNCFAMQMSQHFLEGYFGKESDKLNKYRDKIESAVKKKRRRWIEIVHKYGKLY
ncbi:MAG: lipopolysaccharide kinase InaA family protein [Planctomycetota bacterium]